MDAESAAQQEEVPAGGSARVDDGTDGPAGEEPEVHGEEAGHHPAGLREEAEGRALRQPAALRDLQGAGGGGRNHPEADEDVGRAGRR